MNPQTEIIILPSGLTITPEMQENWRQFNHELNAIGSNEKQYDTLRGQLPHVKEILAELFTKNQFVKYQDIDNALPLTYNTSLLIGLLREEGWLHQWSKRGYYYREMNRGDHVL